MEIPGNLLLKIPGAPSCGSSTFFQVFSQRCRELKLNFKPEFFSLLKPTLKIRGNQGPFLAESRNSNPNQEEFPVWKVAFPFLRQSDTPKMQHSYIHHPGGKENPFRFNSFRNYISILPSTFFPHSCSDSESCLKSGNKAKL